VGAAPESSSGRQRASDALSLSKGTSTPFSRAAKKGTKEQGAVDLSQRLGMVAKAGGGVIAVNRLLFLDHPYSNP